MTRWKITIEYDGRGFSGWQRQPDARSVQQTIEEAIEKFSGETVRLHVSGRTDAGVHARAQIAHFDLTNTFEPKRIMGAINFHSRPHPLSITKAEIVTDDFHARFQAKARTYRFVIVNRSAPLTYMKGLAWHVPLPLDCAVMQSAANMMVGKTCDFSTFRAHHCQAKSPIRTIDKMRVTRDEDIVTIEVKARSFLYHQVRNMAGTLSLVGSGRWTLSQFKEAFEAADRAKGGPTAPPDGLYFWEVEYD